MLQVRGQALPQELYTLSPEQFSIQAKKAYKLARWPLPDAYQVPANDLVEPTPLAIAPPSLLGREDS